MSTASPFTTAEATLLSPNDVDTAQLDSIFGQLAAHQVDDADLYFQYTRSEAWSLEEGQVKSGSFNIDQGVGVRAVVGDKTAFAYSDDIRLPAIREAAATVRVIAAAGQSATARIASRSEGRTLYAPIDPLGSLSESDKVALLHRLEDYARKLDARVTQVVASLAGEYEVIFVTRLDGRSAADVRPLVRVSLQVIVEQDGLREQGSAGGGGRFDYAYFSDAMLREYAEQAVHQALTNLNAKPAPAGNMTVVLGSGLVA